MKILQLGKFYPPDMGGIERAMGDIVEGMNERGVICDVLCSNSRAKFSLDITHSRARIYRTKSFGKIARTSITPQMIFFLRNFISAYNIIHIHLPDPMANLALFCTNLDSKIVILHWHADITKQKYLLQFYKPLQTWLLKRADAIITTSPKYLAQSPFLQEYKAKCHTIPLGIQTPKTTKRKTLGKQITLFALGRFVEYKGFEYAIRALAFLGENFVLMLGGSGELDTHLKNLVKTLNLQAKVLFLGHIDFENTHKYYEKADIFLLPSISKNESFGIVQIEAMAHSVPVVSCAIKGSGVDWVNQHNYSGIVVPPKDPKAIAQAVQTIANNYDFFAINAKMHFQQYFKVETMIDTLYSLYTKTICNARGGGIYYVFVKQNPPYPPQSLPLATYSTQHHLSSQKVAYAA
ncbi:glycosyltransferase [Helicobacter japonicus]|uniref:glycosyltransferase n=1 Tax=Helicobacter japonicus TaxID=425400 RepID=UPI0026390E06|nr:glycosyltransferase [Helicobacter japonicus]